MKTTEQLGKRMRKKKAKNLVREKTFFAATEDVIIRLPLDKLTKRQQIGMIHRR